MTQTDVLGIVASMETLDTRLLTQTDVLGIVASMETLDTNRCVRYSRIHGQPLSQSEESRESVCGFDLPDFNFLSAVRSTCTSSASLLAERTLREEKIL